MRDAEATKMAILQVSGNLFNTYGYKATSISDITKALGMTKGAIYRHFENKAELEKEALIYLCNQMVFKLGRKIREGKNAKEKMYAIFDYFMSYAKKSHFTGGCPLLNAAVEADDALPELRTVVNGIIEMIHHSIEKVLKNGIKHKQLNKKINAKNFSALVFSSFEGGIMLSKVTGNPYYLQVVVKNLKQQFDEMILEEN